MADATRVGRITLSKIDDSVAVSYGNRLFGADTTSSAKLSQAKEQLARLAQSIDYHIQREQTELASQGRTKGASEENAFAELETLRTKVSKQAVAVQNRLDKKETKAKAKIAKANPSFAMSIQGGHRRKATRRHRYRPQKTGKSQKKKKPRRTRRNVRKGTRRRSRR